MAAALLLGALQAVVYRRCSPCTGSFALTLAMLPAVVSVIILMVSGSIGAGVAVAGTFSLVRFRSAPGSAREIAAVFIAMAIAKFRDTDWEKYDKMDDLYLFLRDKRGFDNLDEYILDEVLDLHGDAAEAAQTLVGDCAERAKRALFSLDVEPGTVDAFKAYVACLQCMYQLGMAVQLKSMGYHMTKI